MTAERLFSILNLIALAAWLPLGFLPRKAWVATVVPMAIPCLLAVTYVVLTFFVGAAGLLLYLTIRWFAPDNGALRHGPAKEGAE